MKRAAQKIDMEGRVKAVYPEGYSSVYNYLCLGEAGDLLSFPVEWRYHRDILEGEGDPVGRLVSYRDDVDPSMVEFLD